jgi:LacI family transcriptional regulator, galactose operon repressor
MANRKNITIKDIARMAGVSAGTVDRVIHNRGRVSEEALQKVVSVLDQIDYKPNLIARTLGSKRNYRIAVLVPDPEQDPYWELCGRGIKQAETEWTQYGVTVEPFFFDPFNRKSYQVAAESANEAEPDGLLIAPIFYHEALPYFDVYTKGSIPYVLFNTNIPEAHPLSFIGQDLYQSGRVGAELMNIGQHGPGSFAVLHIYEDLQNSIHLLEKERGFRDFFLKHNGQEHSIETYDLSNHDETAVEEKILRLLDNPSLRGIFASTSSGTYISASVLQKHGKNEVRLIGYDMLEQSLDLMRSGIIDFLINQNPKRQAFLGVSHLANHLLFRKHAPPLSLFPLEVITPQNLDSYLNSGLH